jgi:hypothetical protein
MKSPSFRMYRQGQIVEVPWHEDPATPAESEAWRRFWPYRLAVWIVVIGLLFLVVRSFR